LDAATEERLMINERRVVTRGLLGGIPSELRVRSLVSWGLPTDNAPGVPTDHGAQIEYLADTLGRLMAALDAKFVFTDDELLRIAGLE
jgi:hypothetical protein